MGWTLDDLENGARHEDRLARSAVSDEERELHRRAAVTLRSRLERMRHGLRASIGLNRHP